MARDAGISLRQVVEVGAQNGEEEPGDEGEKPSFSPLEIAQFAARAARKNVWFCLLVMLGLAVVGSTVVVSLPVMYNASGKIFVQHSGMVTSSLASGREQWKEVDGKRGLQEILLAQDNLMSIVREAKLVESWPRTRPAPLRVKDFIATALFGTPSRKDMEHSFADMLSTLIIGTEEAESVRIEAQWRDPQAAYEIATLLQRNFLAARAASELGPIKRAISVLEGQLEQAEVGIANAVTALQTVKGHEAGKKPDGEAATAGATPEGKDVPSAELAGLSRKLSAVRRQQRELSDPWRKRLSELKTQLVEMNTAYSPEHPLVRQQEAKIAGASEVPPELAALRDEEAALLSAVSSHGGMSSLRVARAEAGESGSTDDPREDPALAGPKARLAGSLRKSDEIAGRLDLARVELATSESEFKHRYVVVQAPEVPIRPMNRKRPLFFAAALFVAALLGFLSGAVRELWTGRLVEPWQVRALGLEILAEVDLKELPPPPSL